MSASHRPWPGQPGPPPGPAGPPAAPPRPRRTAALAVAAVTVLVLDLVSKLLVVAKLQGRPPVKLPGGFLWLAHARNSGAAFSFAEGATVLFTAVAAIVIVVIVRTASKLRSTAWAISLGLVLGGAAGNLVDRLFRSPAPLRGQVVDWISLRTPDGKMLFPIFNLADSGIVCGGILAVLLAVLGYEMDGSRGPDPEPASPLPRGSVGSGPAAGPPSAPTQGSLPAPAQGSLPAPPQGRPLAPPQGPSLAPPQGPPPAPPQGRPLAPPQGPPPAPPRGYVPSTGPLAEPDPRPPGAGTAL